MNEYQTYKQEFDTLGNRRANYWRITDLIIICLMAFVIVSLGTGSMVDIFRWLHT